ncbi:MAG: D-cysteine desulfhydrase family protein [Rhodospirillales bacterium]|nr:MAG: D-cysteine desulfhydrase family protein [Rhodospirillales bacterium]
MSDRLKPLEGLPRTRLGHYPTPLEAMPRLAAELGRGGGLYVKRDDCTGLAFGGNKVRQLEFYFGEALSEGADTVLITGAVQSNFARSTAAAAARLGMACHIQLEERVAKSDPEYRRSGNVLLDRMLGATLHSYPDGEDEAGADRRLREIAAELKSQGRRPYVIPLAPGHKPLGALGYVDAAREIVGQFEALSQRIDEIVVASGSGATHGGLLFGLRALGSAIRVTGICVRRAADNQRARIIARCREIADLLEIANVVDDADVILDDSFLAPGYGRLNEATLHAIDLAARCEALILDPVYTGKVLAGTIARAGETGPDHNILFLHSGGTPATFAYSAALTEALAALHPQG